MDINLLKKELHVMQQSYASLFSVVNKVQTRGGRILRNVDFPTAHDSYCYCPFTDGRYHTYEYR